MERFFQLAKHGDDQPAGWAGQITSNSFMKREFGSSSSRTSWQSGSATRGRYFWRLHPGPRNANRDPGWAPPGARRPTVRAVLGVRGEPGQPQIRRRASCGLDRRSRDRPGLRGRLHTVSTRPDGLATPPMEPFWWWSQRLLAADRRAAHTGSDLTLRLAFGISPARRRLLRSQARLSRQAASTWSSLLCRREVRDFIVAVADYAYWSPTTSLDISLDSAPWALQLCGPTGPTSAAADFGERPQLERGLHGASGIAFF